MVLIFLGILHGERRVAKALDRLRPDIVTVEMSQSLWRLLAKRKLTTAYAEVKSCLDYGSKHGIPVLFIDQPMTPKQLAQHIAKINAKQSRDANSLERDKIYDSLHRHYVRRSKETENVLDDTRDFRERTKYMRKRLERLLRHSPGKIIVHVGGAGHFLNPKGARTLFSAMKRYRPRRLLLPELV